MRYVTPPLAAQPLAALLVAATTVLAACDNHTPMTSDGDAVQKRAVDAQTARRRTGAEIQERALNSVIEAVYVCVDGDRLMVDFDNRRAMATVRNARGEGFDLHLERAESGLWYRSSGTELRGQGTEAVWTVQGRQPVQCRAVD